MQAGKEYYLHADLHWDDPEVAKDFSVVAQGVKNGDIEITHWKGLESKKLAIIERKEQT